MKTEGSDGVNPWTHHRHQIEVGGQFYAPTTILPWKELTATIQWRLGNPQNWCEHTDPAYSIIQLKA
jgi:hypothetical protein